MNDLYAGKFFSLVSCMNSGILLLIPLGFVFLILSALLIFLTGFPSREKKPQAFEIARSETKSILTCSQVQSPNAREPIGDEIPLFQMLRRRAKEFTDHLRKYYASNAMTQRLINRWNGEVLVSTKNTGGTFLRGGCLILNPKYETQRKGGGSVFDSEERLLTRLLHELAHTNGNGHDATFYDTQRWFLRVATEELKWKVAVNCRVCCYLNGLCSEAICPKCTWLETGCAVPTRCGDVP